VTFAREDVVVVQREDRLVLEERAFGLYWYALIDTCLSFSLGLAYVQVYTQLCNYGHIALSAIICES